MSVTECMVVPSRRSRPDCARGVPESKGGFRVSASLQPPRQFYRPVQIFLGTDLRRNFLPLLLTALTDDITEPAGIAIEGR
jgi:hypothetical protein